MVSRLALAWLLCATLIFCILAILNTQGAAAEGGRAAGICLFLELPKPVNRTDMVPDKKA